VRHSQALPAAVAEVRSEAADQAHLGGGESVRRVGAVQAQVAPAAGRGDQRGAQLITQAQRRHDLAVPGAGRPLAAGGRVQRRDVPGAHGERCKLVDIVAAELVVQEPGRRPGQRVLGGRAGEQQRRRVGGGEEHGIDAQQGVDEPHGLGLKRWAVQARIAAAHQVTLAPCRRAPSAHATILRPPDRQNTPTFEGWCQRTGRRTV
jgi:hypothetical protein